MRILITGGAGFIGQHLARRLSPVHELIALDLLAPQVHLDPAASRAAFPGEVLVADVADERAWAALPRPDAVIHLAAETGTGQSMYEVERYRAVNIGGTALAGAAAAGWRVPLVAMSSRAVYGEGRYRLADGGLHFGAAPTADAVAEASAESDPHLPVSVYGETKSEGEAALAEVAALIPVSILRPQNVVGPGQALHNPYTGVLAAFLARLREGRPISVYGDGTASRDFVSVTDVAATLDWLVTHPHSPGTARVLNSGTGVRTNLDELAAFAILGTPTGQGVVDHVEVHRAGDIQHACADLSLADSLGVPPPAITSQQAISSFIAWSWDKPGASSQAWDSALAELAERGLAG